MLSFPKASSLTRQSINLPKGISAAFPGLSVSPGKAIGCVGGTAVTVALSVAASACPKGKWTAIIESNSGERVNPAAARELGIALERTLWISTASAGWSTAVAMCLEVCAVVVAPSMSSRDMRRLQARANSTSALLVLIGEENSDVVFYTSNERWQGLMDGYGHLMHRETKTAVKARHAAPMKSQTIVFGNVRSNA